MSNLKKVVAAALLVLTLTFGYSWSGANPLNSAVNSISGQINSGLVINGGPAGPPSGLDGEGCGAGTDPDLCPTPTPTSTPTP